MLLLGSPHFSLTSPLSSPHFRHFNRVQLGNFVVSEEIFLKEPEGRLIGFPHSHTSAEAGRVIVDKSQIVRKCPKTQPDSLVLSTSHYVTFQKLTAYLTSEGQETSFQMIHV